MPTTKRAFIHVGTHKTASTSIQKFLVRNRKALLKRGVFLPLLPDSNETSRLKQKIDDANYHLPIVRALDLGMQNPRARKTFNDLGNLIENCSGKNILLTSEIFEDQLSKKNIEILETFFSSLGYKSTFIAYIRNQPDYINSRYTQTVKRFWDDCSFEEYLQQASSMSIFDYGRLFCEVMSNEKISFVPRSFDVALKKGIERDFLNIILDKDPCGFTDFEFLEGIQNQAPGPITIFTAMLIRKTIVEEFPDEAELYKLWEYLKKISFLKNWNKDKFVGISTFEARDIESIFQQKNDAFAHRVWGESWSAHFQEKEFNKNVFYPEYASSQELWEIDCVIEKILNRVRLKNGVSRHFLKDLSRYFTKHRRYL